MISDDCSGVHTACMPVHSAVDAWTGKMYTSYHIQKLTPTAAALLQLLCRLTIYEAWSQVRDLQPNTQRSPVQVWTTKPVMPLHNAFKHMMPTARSST